MHSGTKLSGWLRHCLCCLHNSSKKTSKLKLNLSSRIRTRSEVESTDDTSDTEATGRIEYYKGNLLLPIFSQEKNVLSPAEMIPLLHNVGKPNSPVPLALVSAHQPLRVEHHVSFIVDLESLKSNGDVKCDDAGCWRNNSNSKFKFASVGNEWIPQCDDRTDDSSEKCVLRREYFVLKDGNKNDLRKRIDTIRCKYRLAIEK